MVDTIFPGSRQPKDDRIEQRKLRKREINSRGGNIGELSDRGQSGKDDAYRRMPHPPGFSSQLPKFATTTISESSDRSLNPTLAYIVVGPRVRGKFDVEKAAALGLPLGQIRSRLTRGETVSFMAEDGLGQGGKVERFVRPEDCIGEIESPGVSTPSKQHSYSSSR